MEEDDFVLISFVGTVDGEAYEGNTVDKYLYEMGQGLMPAEFDDGLLGADARARSAGSSSRFRRPRRLRTTLERPPSSTSLFTRSRARSCPKSTMSSRLQWGASSLSMT